MDPEIRGFSKSLSVLAVLIAVATVLLSAVDTVRTRTARPDEIEISRLSVGSFSDAHGRTVVMALKAGASECDFARAVEGPDVACSDRMKVKRGTAMYRMPDKTIRHGPMPAGYLIALGLPLNINAALAEDVEIIPGIGPSLAGAIVADRNRRGPFTQPKDLQRVRGIGPAKVELIRQWVEFGPGK